MKKRIVVILLLLVLMFALFACGEILPGGEGDDPNGGNKPSGGDTPPVVDVEDGFFKSDMTWDEVVTALSSQVKSYSMDYNDKTTQYVGAKPSDENRNFSFHARFTQSGYSYNYYKFEKNYEIAFFFDGDVYYELYNTGEYTEYLVTDLTGYDYAVDFTQEITDPILDVIEFAKDGAEYKIEENKLYVSKGDYEYVIYDVNNTAIVIPTDMSDYKSKENNFPAMKFEPLEDDNTKAMFTRAHYYLKSVEIPQTVNEMSVVAIGNSAFENNDYLKKVTIPRGIATIYPYAFSSCKTITDIVYGGTMKEWNALVKSNGCDIPARIVVTCSDGVYNADDFILFKVTMTKDEIVKTVKESTRFAIEVESSQQPSIYYVRENGVFCAIDYDNNVLKKSIIFHDGSRVYEYDDQMDDLHCEIIDFSGYDADLTKGYAGVVESLKSDILDGLTKGEYTIENGALKVGDCSMRYWDGESEFELPQAFADYKNIPTTSTPLEFKLSDDETYYILTRVSKYLNVCTMPETYNGLSVKGFDISSDIAVGKIIIPLCVTKLPESLNISEAVLNIEYNGTMEQWYALSKDLDWAKDNNVKVTCSDGDYSYDALKAQWAFNEDMAKDEVAKALVNLNKFSFKDGDDVICYVDVEQKRMLVNMFDENGNETQIIYEFFDGMIHYDFSGDEDYLITDYSGYDIDLAKYFRRYANEGLKFLAHDCVLKGDYTIEEGCLIATDADGRKYVVKGLSDVPKGTIPDKYSDYTTIKANRTPVEYELSEDRTYYTLVNIAQWMTSFVVPETYNGLPVKKISAGNLLTADTVTIPTTIEELPARLNFSFDELMEEHTCNIIYKGTMAQWQNLRKRKDWTKDEHIKVTCSDGKYVYKDYASTVLFSSDMTKDEIIAAVNSSYYIEVDIVVEEAFVRYFLDTASVYCLTDASDGNKYSNILFFEGTKWYEYENGLEGEVYSITDFAGYEASLAETIAELADTLHEGIIDCMSEGYTIEDGCLKAGIYTMKFWDGESDTTRPEVFGTANFTPHLRVHSPLTFELSDDGTYYILKDIHSRLLTCQVPETYNDLPVKEISAKHFSNLKKLVIPACVEKIPTEAYVDTKLSIVYGGTIEQWYQLAEGKAWALKYGISVKCSDGDYSYEEWEKHFTFQDDMTKEEIIQAVKDMEVFSLRYADEVTYFVGEKTMIYEMYYEDGEPWQYAYLFFEGMRYYEIVGSGGNYDLDITDFTGYDVDVDGYIKRMVDDELKGSIYDAVTKDLYIIEDGCLVWTEDDTGAIIVVKDRHVGPAGIIPEEFADYATRETNQDVVGYKLSEDGTYYIIDWVDSYLTSYEVPKTYNGLPVKGLTSSSISTFESVTIHADVTEIPQSLNELSPVAKHVLKIDYKGTKAQWRNLSHNRKWSYSEDVEVTCSDGVYDADAMNVMGYDGSEVTITFYHTMGSILNEVLEKYIVEFNKLYPNIHIVHDSVGGYDDARDQILNDIEYDRLPNMAYCYTDHVALYNETNSVLSLDDFISCMAKVKKADGTEEIIGLTDAQKDDFIQAFFNEGKQFGDNNLYAIPFNKRTDVLYYNKTFFEENNLSVPTTWAEMEEVCSKIKEIDPDSIPLGVDSESNWFINMCAQYGSPYTSATGEHFLFDNETNRAFVEMIKGWYDKGYVTTTKILGYYSCGIFKEITGNRCYMSIGSSAGARHQVPDMVEGTYPFEVGVATIPQVDVNNAKVTFAGPSLCMFDNGDMLEATATWLFIKYMTTNVEFQAEFSMVSGYMSVLKSVQQNEKYAEYLATADGGENLQALTLKVCYEQMDAYFAPDAFVGSDIAREEVEDLLVDVFTDQKTIDEAFTTAIENCNNPKTDSTEE